MKLNKKYNVIDLFVGCGGLLEGFLEAGCYHTVAAVDWDKESCINLRNRLKHKWGYNNADSIVKHFDIQRTEELFKGWCDDKEYNYGHGLDCEVEKVGALDLIVGGPPCQAYSIAGRIRDANGMHDDYRNYLFEAYLKVVKRYRPKAVIFENVQGICSASPGGLPIIDRIENAFNNIGYEVVSNIPKNALIDFSDYGVPQNRKRIILVGLSRAVFGDKCKGTINQLYNELLPAYHVKNKSTVREYISDLPPLHPAENDYKYNGKKFSHLPHKTGFPNHAPRYHNRRDIELFEVLARDVETKTFKYRSADSLKKLYVQRTGKTSNVHKYYVLRWDEQSNTIPAHLLKDGLRHIHPDPKQARSITVREAARLQTFSDDYMFISSQTENYKMIGNAVPPLFSRYLALAFDELLSDSL